MSIKHAANHYRTQQKGSGAVASNLERTDRMANATEKKIMALCMQYLESIHSAHQLDGGVNANLNIPMDPHDPDLILDFFQAWLAKIFEAAYREFSKHLSSNDSKGK